MPLKNLRFGRVVFVKIKYDPWWPAIIWNEEESLPANVKKQKKENHILVKYITDEMDEAPFFGWIENNPAVMLNYKAGFGIAKSSKLKRKQLKEAIIKAEKIYAKAKEDDNCSVDEEDLINEIKKVDQDHEQPHQPKKRGRKKKSELAQKEKEKAKSKSKAKAKTTKRSKSTKKVTEGR